MRVSGKSAHISEVYLSDIELMSLPEIRPKKVIKPKSEIRGSGRWWSEQDKILLRQYLDEGLKYKTIGRLLPGGRTRQSVKRRVQRFRAGIP